MSTEETREPGFYRHPFDPARKMWWNGESWSSCSSSTTSEFLPDFPSGRLSFWRKLVRFVSNRPTWQIAATGVFIFLLTIPVSTLKITWLTLLVANVALAILMSKKVTRAIERQRDPDQANSYSADRLRQPM